MMKQLKRLGEEAPRWPSVSIHAHRLGGAEFRFGSAEVRHTHDGGVVDIPFPPRQGHEYAEQMNEAAAQIEQLRQDLVSSRSSESDEIVA